MGKSKQIIYIFNMCINLKYNVLNFIFESLPIKSIQKKGHKSRN